jgi:hypothetical protein
MSRSLWFALLVPVVALVATPSPRTHGCAVAPGRGGQVSVSSENALIVYDSATKTEHFIRTATFTTALSSDFGFLVPTPSKPELAEASPDVFRELAVITKPRTVVQQRMKEPNFGCFMLPAANATFAHVGSAIKAAAPSVQVVQQKRVGAFDAAVLKADDPKALREWLQKNGYEARPQLEEWFKAYTANKWYLTAFKVATGDIGGATAQNTAVRISFPTETPFYPYREPEDARTAAGLSRSLKLYVLSDSRVSGTIGNGDGANPFPGRTDWSNPVDAAQVNAVAAVGKLPAEIGSRTWHLTEFTDASSPRPGTDEVYFATSTDQSAVERPPHVVYEYYDPWPWVWMGVFVFGAVFVAQMVWRAARKKA